MFIDMHSHSVASDDSRATVEQYVRWINAQRKKGYQIDGFVLTEHRQFDHDADYSQLAREYGVLILKGSELDTRHGHFLVYGVSESLTSQVNFADIGMDSYDLIQATHQCGAIAIPAHPGRFGIGLYEFIQNGTDFSDIRIVERLNGSNRKGEQERAEELIQRYGYLGIGGSDAHFVSAIGTCLTEFKNPFHNEDELVQELRGGQFYAVHLEDTRAH